ncbi:MAG: hypothetical protein R3359_07130, partial [Marinirhabdus sp.]|nr:hypothetical protein [Marinirhabdus sp.]
MLDISIIVLVVVLGFLAKNTFVEHFSKRENITLNLLWIYHLSFAILYYFYVNSTGGDARNYWFTVKENTSIGFLDYFQQGFGTYSMYAINYFPSAVLDLSFLTGSIAYSLLGYLGFIYLFVIFRDRIKFNSKLFGIQLFPIILFLPNLHFWTCNVGKDTILFLCIVVVFYAMQAPKKHLLKIILSLVIAYFVRPHIAAFLLVSFGLGLILDGNLKMYYKLLFSVGIMIVFIVFFDAVMAYLRIESFDLDTISSYSEDKATKLSRDYTGSSVDISSYPYPLKVFTFLFRPLFFDINGPLAIVA